MREGARPHRSGAGVASGWRRANRGAATPTGGPGHTGRQPAGTGRGAERRGWRARGLPCPLRAWAGIEAVSKGPQRCRAEGRSDAPRTMPPFTATKAAKRAKTRRTGQKTRARAGVLTTMARRKRATCAQGPGPRAALLRGGGRRWRSDPGAVPREWVHGGPASTNGGCRTPCRSSAATTATPAENASQITWVWRNSVAVAPIWKERAKGEGGGEADG